MDESPGRFHAKHAGLRVTGTIGILMKAKKQGLISELKPLILELKEKLKKEGNETVTNCHTLKTLAAEGKMRMTDVADSGQLFRLIQSIPSPKSEPFKLWQARVAAEQLDEMQDPELSIDRGLEQYVKLGYTETWINQLLKSIEIRKELTDEWKNRGLKEGKQFATLTDIMTKAWAGKTTKKYMVFKGLKKENRQTI